LGHVSLREQSKLHKQYPQPFTASLLQLQRAVEFFFVELSLLNEQLSKISSQQCTFLISRQ
jgi:hypothetical protein